MTHSKTYVMPAYTRQPVSFIRGDGARLWDQEGNEYLDGIAGIAVASLGHSHPEVTRAIADQAGTLMHTSNVFRIAWQEKLGERLIFSVEAHDSVDLISKGRHERFVIDKEKFDARVGAKAVGA